MCCRQPAAGEWLQPRRWVGSAPSPFPFSRLVQHASDSASSLPRQLYSASSPCACTVASAPFLLTAYSGLVRSCAQRRFVTRSSSFTKEEFEELLAHTAILNGGWRLSLLPLLLPLLLAAAASVGSGTDLLLPSTTHAVGPSAASEARPLHSHLPPNKLESPAARRRVHSGPRPLSCLRLPMVR